MRVALVAGLVGGCASGNAYLDRRNGFSGEHVEGVLVASVPVHGSHVILELADSSDVSGELLAVDADTIVVRESDGATIAVRWSTVEEVRLKVAPSRPGEPATSIVWTTVGTLSTLSHGIFLIFTVPVWLGAGIPSSIVHGQSLYAKVTAAEVRAQLYQFARYPQGMPTPPAAPAAPAGR